MDKLANITELTSQCVMCAACLPGCPTYQATLDENLSPRGRISLVMAASQNKIRLSDSVISHFDSCLQCLNCQTVCPSQVNYSEIINYAMESSFSHKKANYFSLAYISEKLSNLVLLNKWYRSLFIRIVNFLVNKKLMIKLKRFAGKYQFKAIALLPEQAIKLPDNETNKKYAKEIYIFGGCANSLFAPSLSKDIADFFNKLQVSVNFIDSAYCCGAIYKKQGNKKLLTRLENTINSEWQTNHKVISVNSACSAHIKESKSYKQLYVDDIITYLANSFWKQLRSKQFNPFSKKVFYHQSCSMRNILNSQDDCLKLLKLIPDIDIMTFSQATCCGAGGNYMLSHPQLAEKIVSPYVQFLVKENIHIMLGTDISCSLHIKQQLELLNYKLEVMHPLTLLRQQLI